MKMKKIKLKNISYVLLWGILLLISFMLARQWFHSKSSAIDKSVHVVDLKTEVKDEQRRRNSQLKKLLQCHDRSLKTELLQHGEYWVLKNVIRGRLSMAMGCADSITFTTIGDYSYMHHLERVLTRWLGPISFALYAPGYDFAKTMDSIQYVRHCLPVSQLIRDYVSFHIYFPNDHVPLENVPETEEEALAWPHDCFAMFAPYDSVKHSELYWQKNAVSFPINVGRNLARKTVNTHFIFACDIELYPSVGFIGQFLELTLHNASSMLGGNGRRVWAVPVFELDINAIVPDTKDQLMTMYEIEMAMPYHKRSCSYCKLIPDEKSWIQAKDRGKLEVIAKTKRYGNFPFWQPYYVSDNTEPEYDERLPWEGLSDKRLHSFVMCLLDYEYHILHPAFLTHAPGIKPFDPDQDRMFYVDEAAVEIMPEYGRLYGENERCQL